MFASHLEFICLGDDGQESKQIVQRHVHFIILNSEDVQTFHDSYKAFPSGNTLSQHLHLIFT